MSQATDLKQLLSQARVLPVLTVGAPEEAVSLVRRLAAEGFGTVEITLRSPASLEALAAVVREVPEVLVGAGTVLDEEQLKGARKAGARFAVSPGLTPALITAARRVGLPWLPGVATPSEAMTAAEAGFTVLKLFPAAAVGGLALLRSLRGPLPHLAFCPTGGLDETTYPQYLEQPNVICVGGSWMVNS
jgi:2-dehydro-3-deoxyphosphogluconate aldolase/(4S)-4-hydroxy-2-oxoglutarate aldolase